MRFFLLAFLAVLLVIEVKAQNDGNAGLGYGETCQTGEGTCNKDGKTAVTCEDVSGEKKCGCVTTKYYNDDTGCADLLGNTDECDGNKKGGCPVTDYCKPKSGGNPTCQKKIGNNAGPCTGKAEGECADADYCQPGATTNDMKKCQTKVALDVKCDIDAACETANAACATVGDKKQCACTAKFYKKGTTCEAKIAHDQKCKGGVEGECVSTDYCKLNTDSNLQKCTTKLAGGAECKDKTQCKSGICNKEKPADPKGKCSGATVLNASVLTFLMIAIMSTFFKSG